MLLARPSVAPHDTACANSCPTNPSRPQPRPAPRPAARLCAAHLAPGTPQLPRLHGHTTNMATAAAQHAPSLSSRAWRGHSVPHHPPLQVQQHSQTKKRKHLHFQFYFISNISVKREVHKLLLKVIHEAAAATAAGVEEGGGPGVTAGAPCCTTCRVD